MFRRRSAASLFAASLVCFCADLSQAAAMESTTVSSEDACVVAQMPSTNAIFASQKRIFSHYFPTFPLSIDNAPAAADYYNKNFLQKTGESGKWSTEGGYLRQRPLGVAVGAANTYRMTNYETEIRSAIARGITGFAVDVMSTSTQASSGFSVLENMLTAAQNVDSRFKIIPMPDMSALGSNADAVIEIVSRAASSPASYRLNDGRLVVSPFNAGLASPAFWESVLHRLSAQGIDVAFVGTFLGWSYKAAAFNSFSYGFSDWGTATVEGSSYFEGVPDDVRATYGKIFMSPLGTQQFRPKDFVYWEASNSGAFRSAWMSAISGDSDWVQNVTWNDFSESSEIEPYTDATLDRTIGTGFYDLQAYYASWFLTGKQPTITHDVLYYFYRREPTNSVAHAQRQTDKAESSEASENQIELLAFLTSPGTLSISLNGKTYTQQAPAGMTSFKVPTAPGTPEFALRRNSQAVISFEGGVQIYGSGGLPSGVEDLTYWSGSASASGKCSL